MSPSPPTWQAVHIPFTGGSIAGKITGEGNRLLLCLHGYQQDRHAFDALWSSVPDGWRILCLDLPPFGESLLLPNGITAWQEWAKNLRQSFPTAEWHLLGYSMGGKLALLLLQEQLLPTQQVFLLAPDGIKSHPIQHFATNSRLGLGLFRWSLSHPTLICRINERFHRWGLVHRFLYRFVHHHFQTPTQREYLWESSQLYSQIPINWPQLSRFSRQQAISWHVFWGKKDPLYPVKATERIIRQLGQSHLHLLPGGHKLLQRQVGSLQKLLRELLD